MIFIIFALHQNNKVMMYLKTFFTTFISMFVFIFGFTQSQGAYTGDMSGTIVTDESPYISAHTTDRDTLYLADNSTGHILKEAWEMSDTVSVNDTVEKPHIIMVDPDRIARFEQKRGNIVVHKQYKGRNE